MGIDVAAGLVGAGGPEYEKLVADARAELERYKQESAENAKALKATIEQYKEEASMARQEKQARIVARGTAHACMRRGEGTTLEMCARDGEPQMWRPETGRNRFSAPISASSRLHSGWCL